MAVGFSRGVAKNEVHTVNRAQKPTMIQNASTRSTEVSSPNGPTMSTAPEAILRMANTTVNTAPV